jgi:hypothetical protein
MIRYQVLIANLTATPPRPDIGWGVAAWVRVYLNWKSAVWSVPSLSRRSNCWQVPAQDLLVFQT